MSVFVAYLHPDTVSHSFMDSLWRVNVHELQRGEPFCARFAMRAGPMSIPEGRNTAVSVMLEQTDAEWLWFVDSDMGFYSDCLEDLLTAADADERPIMGAFCYGQFTGQPDGMGGYKRKAVPTLYFREEVDGGWEGFTMAQSTEWPANSMIRVGATGAACLLIHRRVLTAMREKFPEGPFTRISRPDGSIMGEDTSFFERAWLMDFPAYVHTGIRTTHHKAAFLGQE